MGLWIGVTGNDVVGSSTVVESNFKQGTDEYRLLDKLGDRQIDDDLSISNKKWKSIMQKTM